MAYAPDNLSKDGYLFTGILQITCFTEFSHHYATSLIKMTGRVLVMSMIVGLSIEECRPRHTSCNSLINSLYMIIFNLYNLELEELECNLSYSLI